MLRDECPHLTDSVEKLFVGSLLRADGSEVSAGDFFNRMGAKRTFKPTDADKGKRHQLYTNWKKWTEFELWYDPAECIARWLDLSP